VEVGGTSGTLVSANDADVRGLTSIASGVSSSFSSFYGKSSGISITMGGSSSVGEVFNQVHIHGYKISGGNFFGGTTSAVGSMSNNYVNGGSSGTYLINFAIVSTADGKLALNNINFTLSSAATFSGFKLTHADGRSYCIYKGGGSGPDYSSTLMKGFRADGTEMSENERGFTSNMYSTNLYDASHLALNGWSSYMAGAVNYSWLWNERPSLNPQNQLEALPVLQKFAGNIIDKTLTFEWL